MRWDNWGARVSYGAYGVDASTGYRVRVVAYKQRSCDGRNWFSQVNVVIFRTEQILVLRHLPVCAEPPVGG